MIARTSARSATPPARRSTPSPRHPASNVPPHQRAHSPGRSPCAPAIPAPPPAPCRRAAADRCPALGHATSRAPRRRRPGLRGVAIKEHLGEAQLHLERNEVLLSAVVKIAFEPAALEVLRLHQPLPRRPELVEP